ncbi:NnrS family protein [Aquabacterium sp.]|uniref:NnrS family protein n=1 Tax=Aquabacterium sp. TaxID=1872578 RepID=UPI0035B169BF
MPADKTVAPRPASSPAPDSAAALAPAPWRWVVLLNAPHRLAFFSAAVVMTLSAAWWWVEIFSRLPAGPLAHAGLTLGAAVPATFVHALVMSLGFMPLFFCGFLFTAGPKWLQMPEVAASAIARPVAVMVLGWAGWLIGAHVGHLLAAAGLVLVVGGWARLTVRFIDLVRRSPARDRLHASVIAVACVVGVAVLASAAVGALAQHWAAVRLAALLGLWWFVVPVYVTVAHRMIPFFTASALPVLDAWRPNWLLWTLLAAVGLQGGWVLTDALAWQSPGLNGARVFSSGVFGLLVLALAVRWGLVQSLRIRLLAMLHLGFVWLGVALLLDAVAVACESISGVTLNLLPLHALTMGFLGSVLIAMVTRVSCGHGGRPLAADNLVWGLFWTLQGAVVLRLVGAIWAAQAPVILLAAASVWLIAVGGWAVRYGRWYGRPRLDGRPG